MAPTANRRARSTPMMIYKVVRLWGAVNPNTGSLYGSPESDRGGSGAVGDADARAVDTGPPDPSASPLRG
jgi:hypothetical protein